MNIKPKNILSGLTVLWIVVVLLEGASSIIRFWYSRKMNPAIRAASGLVSSGKAAFMVVLAVANVILFMRHFDER